MPTSVGVVVLIAYGVFVGLMIARVIGVSPDSWANVTTIIKDLTTTAGIVIGGWWAYRKYIHHREDDARAELAHHVTTIEVDGQLLLRVVLEIKNVGPVRIESAEGNLLVQIPHSALSTGTGDPHNNWKTIQRIEYPFRDDKLCIDPGASERYPRDIAISADIAVVQLHSRVSDDNALTMWDETTVHFLKPKPATTVAE